MFKSQNFCHIASNNRNQVKVGVFVYRTTDDLQTVLTNGYFNERIIDINLHDLIIHEKIDNADNTKVIRNVLCVTERTLENVGTSLIKSNWEETTEETLESLAELVQSFQEDIVAIKEKNEQQDTRLTSIENGAAFKATDFETPITGTNKGITQAEGLVLENKIDLAANSGDQLYSTGVWYAKMYAATVAPSAENGTNYADFSQTDTGGNPIIVIYTRTNGAWVETTRITPPADYNGYMTITSKIWDITEQAGQQGGKVLWSHNQKTFTPYPQIISFDSPNITNPTITNATITGSTFSGSATLSGTSEVELPVTPTDEQIVNKKYVDDAISSSGSSIPKFFWDYTWVNDEATWGSSFWTTKNPIVVGSVLRDGYLGSSAEATVTSVNGNSATVGVRAILFRDPDGDYSENYSWGAPNFIQVYTTTATPSTSSTWTNTPTSGQGDFSFSGTVISVGPNNSYIEIQFAGLNIGKSSTESEISTDSHIVIDFQEPSADNNYTWYRLYKDGWVEQGGLCSGIAADNPVTMLIEMSDTEYQVLAIADPTDSVNSWGWIVIVRNTKTTTGFSLGCRQGGGIELPIRTHWQVSGMAKG